jgi:hypothetical protein
MGVNLIPGNIHAGYEIHEWRHATAILRYEFPGEFKDVVDVLGSFRLLKSYIDTGGGRKSQVSAFIDSELYKRAWVEKRFDTKMLVDGVPLESPTHGIDCFKNRVALEIEWNNKDPFFDRDLNNFRLLFDLRVVSVGVIITRCDELQMVFDSLGRGKSYGSSTTHMSKLLPRIEGGGGGGCPTLIFGIRQNLYVDTPANNISI